MDFIEQVYKITNKFPKTEMYGLTSQIRRVALSIALNIAEGSGAGSDNEFNRFLNIALRSGYEVMCGIEVGAVAKYRFSRHSESTFPFAALRVSAGSGRRISSINRSFPFPFAPLKVRIRACPEQSEGMTKWCISQQSQVAKRLNYCCSNEEEGILKNCDELAAMISGFKKKLKAES